MNEKSLNVQTPMDASLSQLYRRMTAQRADAVGVDELAAVAAGSADETIAAKLAASSRHADLARLLRELEPASAELAESVRRQGCAHPQRGRDAARPAHRGRHVVHRGARWLGGFAAAACLALALGVVGLWHGRMEAPHSPETTAAVAPDKADRIFTSNDRIFSANDMSRHAKSTRGGDELFRSDFAGG